MLLTLNRHQLCVTQSKQGILCVLPGLVSQSRLSHRGWHATLREPMRLGAAPHILPAIHSELSEALSVGRLTPRLELRLKPSSRVLRILQRDQMQHTGRVRSGQVR